MGNQTGSPRKLVCSACREKKIKCEQDAGHPFCRYCIKMGFICSGPKRTDRYLEKQQKKKMHASSSQRTVPHPDISDVHSGQKQIVPAAAPALNPDGVSVKGTARSMNVPASVEAPLNYGYHQNGAPNAPAYPYSVANALGCHMHNLGDPLLVNNYDRLHMPSWQYIQPEMVPASVANQNVPRGTAGHWSHETIQSAYADQNANFETFPNRPMDLPACNLLQNVQINNAAYDVLDEKSYEELLRSIQKM